MEPFNPIEQAPPSVWVWEDPSNLAFTSDVYDLLDKFVQRELIRYVSNPDLTVSRLEDIEPFNHSELMEYADIVILPIKSIHLTKEDIDEYEGVMREATKRDIRVVLIHEIDSQNVWLHELLLGPFKANPGLAIVISNSNFDAFEELLHSYFSELSPSEFSNVAIAERRIKQAIRNKATTINLGNLGLSKLPMELSKLAPFCEEVILGHKYYDTELEKHRFLPTPFGRNNILIQDEFFHFPKLHSIYLSNNAISTRSATQFLYDNKIQNLDLSYTIAQIAQVEYEPIKKHYLNVSQIEFRGITRAENEVHTLIAHRVISTDFQSLLFSFILNRLTKLDLSYSNPQFYRKISDFTQLKHLILKTEEPKFNLGSENAISASNARKLESIVLGNIPWRSSSETFAQLKFLKLDGVLLSGEFSLSNTPVLEKLHINRCRIKNISFNAQKNFLAELNFDHSVLTDLTPLVQLKVLKSLSLNYCSLPNDLSSLAELPIEKLSIRASAIDDWNFLTKMPSLKDLNVTDNLSFGNANIDLGKLTRLRANSCRIEDLSIYHLNSDIEILELINNNFPSIFPLEKQMRRGLRLVTTSSEPKVLGNLQTYAAQEIVPKNKPGIYVYNNQIREPGEEILLSGRRRILRHIESISASRTKASAEFQKDYHYNEVKIIVVGNPNVGKTHLSQFIASNRTSLPSHNASTNGMQTKAFPITLSNGKIIKARLLDFGGQEYFHDTHHLFFTSDTVYLALWNWTSNAFASKTEIRIDEKGKESHEPYDMFPLDYWLDAIRQFSHIATTQPSTTSTRNDFDRSQNPSGNVIVVQTRRGSGGFDLRAWPAIKQYEEIVHSAVAIDLHLEEKSNEIVSLGISSLYENLEDVIDRLVKDAWPGYYKLFIETFKFINETTSPSEIWKKYPSLHQKMLLTEAEFSTFLNYLLDEAQSNINIDEKASRDVAKYLANRGFIFQSDDLICIIPYLFTKKLYAALKRLKKFHGIVPIAEFKRVFNDENIVQIATNSQVVVDGAIDKHIVIPQHLPDKHPDYFDIFKQAFGEPVLAYELTGYIHKSILQRIFTTFKKFIKGDPKQLPVWKNGMILRMNSISDSECIFELSARQDEKTRRIILRQLGNKTDYALLHEIASQLESIIQKVKGGMKYVKLVSNGIHPLVPQLKLDEGRLNNAGYVVAEDNSHVRLADLRHWLSHQDKQAMKKLFISYSSSDIAFMRKLETHLKPFIDKGDIDLWYDRKIQPGSYWDEGIQKNLDDSDLVIFLVSPEFLATQYIQESEIQKVINSNKPFVFLLLKDCYWESVFANSQGFIDTQKENAIIATIHGASNPEKKPALIIGDPENNVQWMKFVRALPTIWTVKTKG